MKHTFIILSSNCVPWSLPKGVENLCPHKNLHMMSIAAFFIIAKTWKQPRCLSVGEWINKLGYIYTMGYLSSAKKKLGLPWWLRQQKICLQYRRPRFNQLSNHEKKWRDLKCVLLSERSQCEKYDPNCVTFWKRQNYGDSKKISSYQCWGEGGMDTQNIEDF